MGIIRKDRGDSDGISPVESQRNACRLRLNIINANRGSMMKYPNSQSSVKRLSSYTVLSNSVPPTVASHDSTTISIKEAGEMRLRVDAEFHSSIMHNPPSPPLPPDLQGSTRAAFARAMWHGLGLRQGGRREKSGRTSGHDIPLDDKTDEWRQGFNIALP